MVQMSWRHPAGAEQTTAEHSLSTHAIFLCERDVIKLEVRFAVVDLFSILGPAMTRPDGDNLHCSETGTFVPYVSLLTCDCTATMCIVVLPCQVV